MIWGSGSRIESGGRCSRIGILLGLKCSKSGTLVFARAFPETGSKILAAQQFGGAERIHTKRNLGY